MADSEEIKISKFLSMVLRHKPDSIGIKLDEDGWADLNQVIKGMNRQGFEVDMNDIVTVVKTNDKQRFSLSDDYQKIKANQGHSLLSDLNLKETRPPEILYHGTSLRYVAAINDSGIMKMQRNYVHLSGDRNTALQVAKRHSNPKVVEVMTGRMFRNGYKFFISENNIWLTDFIPPNYVKIPF